MSKTTFFSNKKKLGIIGGGQLGKMLLKVCNQWDIHTKVLDPDKEAPSRNTCTQFTQGSLQDFDTVYQFAKDCNVVTIEIEHVNVEALKKLESEGIKVHPCPASLEIIQDKGLQKEFYKSNNLPTSSFVLFENKIELLDALKKDIIKIPFVQKTRKAGYDGRGVHIVQTEDDLEKCFDCPCLVEEKINLLHEISIIVARNEEGEIKTFDAVLMDVHADANMLDLLLYPAPIDQNIREEAKKIAESLIEKMNICGLLAVEFLIDNNKKVLINEVAPRPHNSGHQTIESSITSQYEQHIRGILNLPLGSTRTIIPSAMVNLLGAPNYTGDVVYDGIEKCLAEQGVYIHIYGKKQTKPYRKMGHATVTNNEISEAKKIATWVKQQLQVISQ